MLHAHECVSVFTQAHTHKGYSSISDIVLCLAQPFCLVTGVPLIEKKEKKKLTNFNLEKWPVNYGHLPIFSP